MTVHLLLIALRVNLTDRPVLSDRQLTAGRGCGHNNVNTFRVVPSNRSMVLVVEVCFLARTKLELTPAATLTSEAGGMSRLHKAAPQRPRRRDSVWQRHVVKFTRQP